MSDAPFREGVKVEGLEDALDALRESGHRVTAARRLVIEALLDADGPASAEYLARRVGGASTPMDVASVHRNLAQLEELGVVGHVHIGHGPGLYALSGRDEREYLACERCGRVTSVEPRKLDSIRRSIRRRFGYDARFTHFPILGLCESCSAELAEVSAGSGKGGRAAAHDSHTHEHSHGDHVHSHPHAHPPGEHGHTHD
jgi:Fur family transcriptional regulator, ferric uptake regulator